MFCRKYCKNTCKENTVLIENKLQQPYENKLKCRCSEQKKKTFSQLRGTDITN